MNQVRSYSLASTDAMIIQLFGSKVWRRDVQVAVAPPLII
jgi:hypothetical protein